MNKTRRLQKIHNLNNFLLQNKKYNEYFLENSLRIEKPCLTNNLVPILSYNLYYRALCNYILKKSYNEI